jgi:hypothetical protein
MDGLTNCLKHVFNFNDDSKSEILNIIQYLLIAIIPVLILNKSISRYIPEVDDHKSNFEISIEVGIQIIVMFLGLLIIHRIITFIPTFSGVIYPEFHIIYIILAVLMITMSLQTKIGEKVNILAERANHFWNGKETMVNKNNVKVTQPISGQITGKPMNLSDNTVKPSLYTDGTPISSLPSNETNYNNNPMNQQNSLNASNPVGDMISQEPMAANTVLGSGSGFGSW